MTVLDHGLLGDQPFSSWLIWLAYVLVELHHSGILPMGVGLPDALAWVLVEPVINVSSLMVEVGGRCAVQVHLDPVDFGTKDVAVVSCCMAVEMAGQCTGYVVVVAR